MVIVGISWNDTACDIIIVGKLLFRPITSKCPSSVYNYL